MRMRNGKRRAGRKSRGGAGKPQNGRRPSLHAVEKGLADEINAIVQECGRDNPELPARLQAYIAGLGDSHADWQGPMSRLAKRRGVGRQMRKHRRATKKAGSRKARAPKEDHVPWSYRPLD
jgi:hypothetical protein